MARPIRIDTREPGGGAPQLPSVGAALAGPQAVGHLANQAARGVFSLSSILVERAAKQDNLEFIRQSAALHETLPSEIAAADQALDEFGVSSEYSDAAFAALRQDRYTQAFTNARETAGVRHPKLVAGLDGALEGRLGADLTTEFKRQADRRAGRGVETAGDEAVRFIQNAKDLDTLPALAQVAINGLELFKTDNPELSPAIEAEKNRIFRALTFKHSSQGITGQIRFESALAGGLFDSIGIDIIGPTLAQTAEVIPQLANDYLEDYLAGDTYGELTDNGGRFPAFSPTADFSEIEALEQDIQLLPDHLRDLMAKKFSAARQVLTFRNVAMASIEEYFEGGEWPLGLHLSENSEGRLAVDTYFLKAVRPRMEQLNPGSTDAERDEVSMILLRTLNDLGYWPQSMTAMVQAHIQSGNGNPDLLAAIAAANGFLHPRTAVGELVTTSRPALAAQLAGIAPPNVANPFTREEQNRLDIITRNLSLGPAQAVNVALGLTADGEAKPAAGGTAGAGPTSLLLDKIAFEDSLDAGKSLTAEYKKHIANLFPGLKIDKLGPKIQQQITDNFISEFESIKGSVGPEKAREQAMDSALRRVIEANPPVPFLGTVYAEKALSDLLEGGLYPPRMVVLETIEALDQLGLPTDPASLDGTQLIQPIGVPLLRNEFWIMTNGQIARRADGLEAVLPVDGKKSAWKRQEDLVNATQAKGLLAGLRNGTQSYEDARNGLIEAFAFDKDEFSRFMSPAVTTKSSVGLFPVPAFRREAVLTPEQLEAFGGVDNLESLTAFNSSNPETGALPKLPVALRSPKLRNILEETFIKEKRRLQTRRNAANIGLIPSIARLDKMAMRVASEAVLLAVRDELGKSTPDEIATVLIRGTLPSEVRPLTKEAADEERAGENKNINLGDRDTSGLDVSGLRSQMKLPIKQRTTDELFGSLIEILKEQAQIQADTPSALEQMRSSKNKKIKELEDEIKRRRGGN